MSEPTPKRKSIAGLSLDLDNKWSYMKTHGDSGWETFPSYLDIVVPRVLDILKARQLTITFFVVGQDAALEKNHLVLQSIVAAGHEIGNHSFNHEPWLHLYTDAAIEDELSQAEEHIQKATGQKPIGFRGPGFSVSDAVLKVLVRHGYHYDCSTFPTYLGPLARAYYFMTTKLSPEEKEQRKKLFGTFQEGSRPNKSYWWRVGDSRLLEIPVTTMPIFKVPIHVSYVLYLAKFSPTLATLYFRMALIMCKLTGVSPSILLHPLDFMNSEDAPELNFFPAMQMSLTKKLAMLGKILTLLQGQYDVVSMQQYAAQAAQMTLPVREPKFDAAHENAG